MIGLYCLIGLVYALVNIFIRKLDVDDDWTFVFIWIFIWPICFLALIILSIKDKT